MVVLKTFTFSVVRCAVIPCLKKSRPKSNKPISPKANHFVLKEAKKKQEDGLDSIFISKFIFFKHQLPGDKLSEIGCFGAYKTCLNTQRLHRCERKDMNYQHCY